MFPELPDRRHFLSQAGRFAASSLATAIPAGSVLANSQSDSDPIHQRELQTRGLSAVIGDNSAGAGDHGTHRPRYNGIWSLRSVHQQENCFVPWYAGMNLEHFMDELFGTEEGGDYFEPRSLEMKLSASGEQGARLSHAASPLTGISSETTFTVREPDIIDFEFRATLHRPPRAGHWMGFFWASYLQGPECPALFFLDQHERWATLSADQHGTQGANTVCHVTVTDPTLGNSAKKYAHHSLAYSYSQRRFKLPFMYGRPGDGRMMLLWMFDQSERLRLTMSPSGGGPHDPLRTYNPAWDFQYIVPHAQVGQEISFRARLIYRPYTGRNDILQLYDQWRTDA